MINTGYDIDVPNRYPAIFRHLKEIGDGFEEENKNKKTKSKGLYKREDQGQNWWNLRACAYMQDFDKQVIAWQRITSKNQFCLSRAETIILDSMAFISNFGDKQNTLLAFLNSQVVYFWIKINVHEYGDSGFRLSNQYVEEIPIPKIQDTSKIDKLLDLVIRGKEKRENTTQLEQCIDLLIYDIYGLNAQEVEFIENL